MTFYYYIAANYPLTEGTFGEKFTWKKLSDVPKPDDPADLRNCMDLSDLEDEWVKVYETELDFSFVAVTLLENDHIKELLPISERFVYELGGSFSYHRSEAFNNYDSFKGNEKCVMELLDFVKRELKKGESILVYACWDGEEALPVLSESTIHIDTFVLGSSFELENRHLLIFKRD
ncbi:hypothetical protein [Radiobacillus deserti]|uniref:Uncharacterized protein n=1 Tax=Radiobacillus deserti TaxID=2594883 RepID=A0A516KD00_9BACI|nr:hypothetical protein [Radiobacillus deserti]QDP39285.1 hypothetical protein FN924_03200 [Radiobacillus deserti]